MTRYFFLVCCIIIIACNSEKATKVKKDTIISFQDSISLNKEKQFNDLKDTLSKLMYTHDKPVSEGSVNLDSVKQVILKQNSNSIKIYIFSLEGDFSAEGNAGKAFYKNNIISKIELTFYGESGKNVYIYQFKNNKVEVIQQRYDYKTNFMEVKSEKDIIKGEKIEFSTDLEGKVITGNNAEADLDTFYELKKAVPFDLN
jgi:hypothetical protein